LDEPYGRAKVDLDKQLSAGRSVDGSHPARLIEYGDLVGRSGPDKRLGACHADELRHPELVPPTRARLAR
jgi:hypothetical protein